MSIARTILGVVLATGALAVVAPVSADAATGTLNVCERTYVDPSGDIPFEGHCNGMPITATNNTNETAYILVKFGADEPVVFGSIKPGETRGLPFGFHGIRFE